MTSKTASCWSALSSFYPFTLDTFTLLPETLVPIQPFTLYLEDFYPLILLPFYLTLNLEAMKPRHLIPDIQPSTLNPQP